MPTPLQRAELDYLGFLFEQSTEGVWTPSRGHILSTEAPGRPSDSRDLDYYGGHLLAESIARQGDAKWIAAVHNEFPRLLAALQAQIALGATR